LFSVASLAIFTSPAIGQQEPSNANPLTLATPADDESAEIPFGSAHAYSHPAAHVGHGVRDGLAPWHPVPSPDASARARPR